MAYCLNCKAKLEEDDVVCPFCGGETGGRGSLRQMSDKITVDIRTLLYTEDEAGDMDPYDVKENKWAAAFAYFFITLFLPLGIRRQSDFARFHGNQAIVLLLTALFSGGAVLMAGAVLNLIPIAGEILAALLKALWGIAMLCYLLFGLRMAVTGRARALPVIGRLRLLR